MAVVGLADGGLALARVPLCGCGVRGCGNAGVQLCKVLPGGDLLELAGLLRALPVRRAGRTTKVVYRSAATVSGVRVPVTRQLYDLSDEQDLPTEDH
ncbi:MAG TPA: hypothetical protein VMW75_25730 [Thermoanaerobaculia bacterium]|nr:hypothetical protein [Thermoanaerobaculia bacterium]